MFKARTLVPLAVLIAAFLLVLNASGVSLPGFGGGGQQQQANDLVIGKTFRVDDAFEAHVGAPVPLRFQLILPKRAEDSHAIGVVETPPGGVVQFNFRSEDDALMESLFIAPNKIPFQDESGALAPMEDRLALVGAQLEAQAPRLIAQTNLAVTNTPAREVMVGKLRAMELTGTYRNPEDEAVYFYRFLSIPHPDKEQSMYTVSHINQAFSTIRAPDDYARTLSGRAMSTLRLTDRAGQ